MRVRRRHCRRRRRASRSDASLEVAVSASETYCLKWLN
jgi:hypothetical protein